MFELVIKNYRLVQILTKCENIRFGRFSLLKINYEKNYALSSFLYI